MTRMHLIPTSVHGVLDYTVGALLIAAPWLLGFASNDAQAIVPIALGAGAIAYSLLTRYELGLFPVISMTGHLWLDGLSGVFLALSPWIFGFADVIWWPHVLFGVLEIGAAMLTQHSPSRVSSVLGGSRVPDVAHRPH